MVHLQQKQGILVLLNTLSPSNYKKLIEVYMPTDFTKQTELCYYTGHIVPHVIV